MRRQNPLDRYVHSFQHRWETDRQFRAALSGVLALVMVIGLCSCVGVATAFTNVTLANFSALRSSGGANTQTLNTGSHAYTVPTSFPTATVPPWAPQVSPNASPIPNSKTPQPSPSPSPTDSPTPSGGGGGPTATPCTGNCGGGGGNDTLVSRLPSRSTPVKEMSGWSLSSISLAQALILMAHRTLQIARATSPIPSPFLRV